MEKRTEIPMFRLSSSLFRQVAGFGRGERRGDEGLREHAADIVAKQCAIAAKMKFAPGPGPSDFFRLVAGEVEWMRLFLSAGFRRGGGGGDEGLRGCAAEKSVA